MKSSRQTSREIFFSLALAATLTFLVGGESANGARSLKSFWEGRTKTEQSVLRQTLSTRTLKLSSPGGRA